MLKKKIIILLLFARNIPKPVYILFKDISGFFSCSISRFYISRFTDLNFFKIVIGGSQNLKNKAKPKITLSVKPQLNSQTTPKSNTQSATVISLKTNPRITPGNYGDLAYENIIMNFEKLGFSGNTLIDIEHQEFIKDNLSLSEKDKIISEADLICAHEFDLLGSGRVKVDHFLEAAGVEGFVYKNRITDDEIRALKDKLYREITVMHGIEAINVSYEPIDWHVDFKSGYRWDSGTWYKKIKYGHVPGVDIKVPWELSRASHLVTLGQAYRLTSDEKFTKEYLCQLTDWIADNPVSSGVNWVCTMDVAIRVCNWMLSLSFFTGSPLINKAFINKLSKSLYMHGKHIEKNLEKGFLRVKGNHYVSDILGILYLGLFFKFTRFGDRWLKFAIKELKKEISGQVYEDGTDFEASTYYHRLKTELFFYAMFFTIRCSEKFNGSNYIELGNEIFGAEYVLKVKKMFEAITNLVDLNGSLVQTGDNDNGKLHIFSADEIKNMQYIVAISEIFYGGSGLLSGNTAGHKSLEPLEIAGFPGNTKIKEFAFHPSALWLFGQYGKDTWNLLNEKSIKNLDSASFKDSGWYTCKCNNKERGLFFSLNIICGPNGQSGKGGHAHNDKLSFSLDINCDKIFVDPGTYLYTPLESLRNEFRSTLSHNTIAVDNAQQNRFVSNNSFILVDDAKAKVKKLSDTDKYYFFRGEHHGYARLADPVIHERQIIVNKENMSIFIRDILKNNGYSHKYFFNFILAPELNFKINDKNKGMNFFLSDGKQFSFYPVTKSDMDFKVIDAFYSDSYGNKTKISKLSYFTCSEKPVDSYFVISRTDKEHTFDVLSELFNAAVCQN